MAKDLPYFKFFCSEWNDGDITLESFEAQGLFINICSYYWSNECNVSFTKLVKKFRGHADLINNLKDERLFKVDKNDFVSISFLDEQKEEREATRVSRVKGGKASAEARKLKKEQQSNINSTQVQHVLNSSSTQPQLLRREEKREDKIREDVYTPNDITESYFLQRWKDARLYYDKMPTNISKLIPHEKINFTDLKQDYNLLDFEKAITGLFQQKTYPKTRLRPTHFLQREHFETYLTCFTTKEKLFEDKSKSTIQRI